MESRKKILLVITKSVWGGAQRYVYDLAVNLNKNLFDVAVAVGSEGSALRTKLEEAGVRTIIIEKLGRDVKITDDIKVFRALLKLFRSERPDVVHLNSSKIGGLGALAGRVAGVPKIIFTFHGLAFNEDRSNLSKTVIKIIYWMTLFFCHQTIAVSNYIKDRIGKWPLVKNKVQVIYNGVSDIKFLKRDEARRALLDQSPGGSIWIGTIGELHPIKGQRYLIEALAELPELTFVLVIIGEGDERGKLEALIAEKGLKDKVFLAGRMENAAGYLHAFDLFTLTSLSEGLAYAVLEAGLAGLPVIASRTGGVPEVIENHKDGLLVTPGRSNEIRQAFIYLDSHADEVKTFGSNLQKKVKENFSLKKMMEETEKIYLN